jgi:hypothetical protein
MEYLTNYLKANNIKYFYTSAYNDFLVAQIMQENNVFIKELYKRNDVKNNVFFYEDLGFNQWAIKQGLPLGEDSNHPLEDAHLLWSRHFLKYILDKASKM